MQANSLAAAPIVALLTHAWTVAAVERPDSAVSFGDMAEIGSGEPKALPHWPVASEATVPLTTGMLKAHETTPGLGKAEAHRQAMLALMNTPDHPEYAHPAFWAPFVVVGEGAR